MDVDPDAATIELVTQAMIHDGWALKNLDVPDLMELRWKARAAIVALQEAGWRPT